MSTTTLFAWNYRSDARIKINQGGTSSGKTYAILQVIFFRLIEKKRIALVVGQDIPNLKAGALRDFQERILFANPWMHNFIQSYNKTDRRYTFKNGSILEFKSFKDEQDAHSGKRDIAFFNEANGISWGIYSQVAMRTTEEIFLDYNPSSEFYAHERLMPMQESVTFYSNFTHNTYCDQAIVDYLFDMKEEDYESWIVYGLGKTGTIAELCIDNITIVDKMPLSRLRRKGYGMDFGYRADPTALILCGTRNGNELWFDQQIYAHRMKTKAMDITMRAIQIPKRRRIYGDPAESRVIDDLTSYGWNMQEVVKGPNSIQYGLQLLNQYKIFVTERSAHMIKEQKRYRYKVDKETGKVTNDPIDSFNHAWDAARYWAMMNVKPIRRIKTKWTGMAA